MFTRSTLTFLDELAANNNRDWFQANKARYESHVREPALAFIQAMEQPLGNISPFFAASAKKVGGSLMRVHRDTRFSKDKTPYKTNVGIQFRHVRGKDVHAPGYYLHIEPGSVFVGAGIWHPDNRTLQAVRQLIDEYPKEWQALSRKLTGKNGFRLAGASLQRPPRGIDKAHPLLDDLRRKDYIAVIDLALAEIVKKDVVNRVATHFQAASPLVRFICEANDLAY